jgi:hypothetical protein
MSQYMLIRHLEPEEAGSGGTMIGYGIIQADSDEDAARKLERANSFSYKDIGDISTDWLKENRAYSIVKLIQPVKL